eukprot:NODE_9164_length_1442_cov_12.708745.p1 GENE.NODE_9164_length_1442_cov_12.708745~~NODE_9164_length_1442_cov_12.708745.p1  ORF type:complete len:421 (-),score=106.70 NODE_9164_length_1442_cov_12.708745:179-1372(-)
MAEAGLGPWGKIFLMISKNCYMLGIIIVYLSFETTAIRVWLPSLSNEQVRWCIVYPIFLLLSMLKDLKQVMKLGMLGMLATAVQCGTIYAAAGFDLMHDQPREYNWYTADTKVLGASIATFFFGYGSIATMPSLWSQMADSSELPAALRDGFIVVAIVYLLVLVLGYWAFAQRTQENIIKSFDSDPHAFQKACASICSAGVAFNLFISTPTFMYCVVSVFENSGGGAIRTTHTPLNILFRAGLMTALTLTSWKLPYPKPLIDLACAIFSVCNCVVVPLLTYRALKSHLAEHTLPAWAIDVNACGCKKLAFGFAVVIGAAAMVFGVAGGISELNEHIHAAKVTTTTTAAVASVMSSMTMTTMTISTTMTTPTTTPIMETIMTVSAALMSNMTSDEMEV